MYLQKKLTFEDKVWVELVGRELCEFEIHLGGVCRKIIRGELKKEIIFKRLHKSIKGGEGGGEGEIIGRRAGTFFGGSGGIIIYQTGGKKT